MLCEQTNSLLVEYADATLDAATHDQVEQHLEHCPRCQEDYAVITAWQAMASNWHEELPPAWRVPRIQGSNVWEGLRTWFPTLASATALVLVTVMYLQQPATRGTLPTAQPADFETLPALPQASQAAVVDRVLESSREQRQQELTALLKIITAEMNRRSVETEESLRYVISTQLQGQKELDELYRQVEARLKDPAQSTARSNEGVPQ